MSMSSSILFNCKPGPLLCSCSCSSTSSFIFKFKFKFPARSQCSPLPTVEFHATTPRASTHNHNHISIENESVSGAGASRSRRRALVFVAATTTPLLLLFNHEASAVKAAGLVSYCQHFFLPSIHTWILFHFYFFFLCFFRCNWWFWTDIRYYLLGLGKVSLGLVKVVGLCESGWTSQ